jgi:deoxyadenosine/deoxycytidine kinase
MVKLISFEASISAGKTTLINEIFKKMCGNVNFILVEEPVDEWKKIIIDGKDILNAFYSDMINVAFPFQLIALLTRRNLIKNKIEEAIKIEIETGKEVYLITERTVHSDRYIFAKMLHNDGFINNIQMKTYEMWNDEFSREIKVNKFIYLTTSPEVCLKRIKERNRLGEDKITIEYLIECQKYHDDFYENFMSKIDNKIFNTEIVKIGSNEYNILIDEIIEYIKT